MKCTNMFNTEGACGDPRQVSGMAMGPSHPFPGVRRASVSSIAFNMVGGAGDRETEKSKSAGIRWGTWNIGTYTRKDGQLERVLEKRGVMLCCLQETKQWGIEGFLEEGNYVMYYQGMKEDEKSRGKKEVTVEAGVGVSIHKDLDTYVIGVIYKSNRMIIVKLGYEGRVINVISVYAPQVNRSRADKEKFWIEFEEEMRKIPKEDMIWIGGDLNGHIGKENTGYEEAHGGVGYGERNAEGEMILEFCQSFELTIGNTWFTREENRLQTYTSGEGRSIIDYIIVKGEDRKMLKNVKAIAGEEVVRQHKLVVCDMKMKPVKKQKVKWESKIKLWKLKDKEVKEKYEQKLKESNMNEDADVNKKWENMKGTMINVAEEVCGKTKGPPRHKETWWWNEETERYVNRKQECYQDWYKAKERKKKEDKDQREGRLVLNAISVTEVNELKEIYDIAKKASKGAVAEAKRQSSEKFGDMVDSEEGRQNLFKIAKRMVRNNKPDIGGKCLKDGTGKIISGEENLKKTWKMYMERLLNEENQWDEVVDAEKLEGPVQEISKEEVRKAMKKMKSGKAGGPSGVVADMLKAGGDTVVDCFTDLCNGIVKEGRIPNDWTKSTIITLYKGKGDALECGSYRGIKLLEHGLKVFERVWDNRLRMIVEIDRAQFGFMPGRGTTDAIFIVRQVQEKYLGKSKRIYFGFVDLEKAFDRVPRKVVEWALRKEGVNEWMIKAVMSTYYEAKTAVKVGSGVSEEFEVKVGVHQGSVLSPLLFITVMQAVTKKAAKGLPWELLYADDLVLIADSEEELKRKLTTWKDEMEKKGLKVNIGKTKVMCSQYGKGRVNKTARYPCGVCGWGVGEEYSNSIACTKCRLWIHKRCSGLKDLRRVSGTEIANYECRKCKFDMLHGTGFEEDKVMALGVREECEVVDKFCYLGDMLSAGGGADAAVVTRIGCAWKKFRELKPILTCKYVSDKTKGKVYTACVRSVMKYASETWPMKKTTEVLLERNEMRMVRWMCGVTLMDRVNSDILRERLGIRPIGEEIGTARLRWLGHVMRKDDEDWVKQCMELEVEGKSRQGNRKTWMRTVSEDMKQKGLETRDCTDRRAWRKGINHVKSK